MTANAPRVEVRSAGDQDLVRYEQIEKQMAERIAQAACSLLDADLGDQTLSVLLVPFLPVGLQVGAGGMESGALVRMIGPDGDAPPLPLSVTVEVIERAFGAAEPIVSVGLAGVVAGQTGTGPTAEDLVRGFREDAAGGGMEIGDHLASAFASESSELTLEAYAAATCFVQHLLDEFGKPAVREYLRLAALGRRDDAAAATFGRPLAKLVHEWSADASNPNDLTRPLRALWRHVRVIAQPYRWRFVELMSYILVGVSFIVIMPLTTRYLLDTVLPQRDTQRLALFIAVLLAVFIYRALLGLRTAFVSSLLDMRIFFGLQQRMFSHIQRLSHDFHDRTAVGDLMSRMSNDLSQGQQAFSQLAVVPLPAVLNLVAASVTLFVLDWRFGLLVVTTLPILAAIYRFMSPRLRAASLRQQRAQGAGMGTLQEALSGQSALKAFSAEAYAERGYASRVDSMFRSGMRMSIYGASLDSAVGLVTSLPLLAVLGLGGYQVTQGAMSLGTLVAILGLIPAVVQPVTQLADLLETLQKSAGALHRITELLDEPVTVEDSADSVPVPDLDEAVEFRDVSFSYVGDRPAVDGMTLVLPAGSHTAIVGPSGSGKSTLLAMLMRFYDPTAGSVTIDGVNLRDVTLSDLRSRVGLVSQETVLFDATLRENVVLGRPGVTDAQIDAALRAAQLDGFVESLPDGLDTLMGERASRLSGGQRQRVGIARALLRDPALLLLDEPTSALDRAVEQQILATLASARRGRTTVTVTHRVETVASADQIVVMADGRLVEVGRHEDLLIADGAYAALLRQQSSIGRLRRSLDVVSLFAGAPAEAIAALDGLVRWERFCAGQCVVNEGAAADAVYVIESGHAEVSTGLGLQARHIRTLGPGDAFGELVLAGLTTRTATVAALDDLSVGVLTLRSYQDVAADMPQLDEAVDRAIAGRRAFYAEVADAR